MIGKTISFAGNPSKKANKITPSNPIKRPKGSRKEAQYERIVASPIVIFAIIQMTMPAGAATQTARDKTESVRSQRERTSTFLICGRRYGGSSITKEEGIPCNIVAERSLEISKVMQVATTKVHSKSSADMAGWRGAAANPAKKTVIMAISVGKRPLQGTKLFVRIAIIRSRGESIIRQPTTPAALQPSPIDIVRACLPHACALQKA